MRFTPAQWHICDEANWRDCDEAANCYSYVLNNPKYYWSVPGRGWIKSKPMPFFEAFNRHFNGISATQLQKQFRDGAVSDGLISVEAPVNRKGYYLAALCLSESVDDLDFHWYRQDDDGTWSHKDGWRRPSNKDGANQLINDPRTAIRPNYPIFGGFFLVPRGGVSLKPAYWNEDSF